MALSKETRMSSKDRRSFHRLNKMKQRHPSSKFRKMLMSIMQPKVFKNLSRLAWSSSTLVFTMGKKELTRSRAYPCIKKLMQSSTSMINSIWFANTERICILIWIKVSSQLFKMYFSCLTRRRTQSRATSK